MRTVAQVISLLSFTVIAGAVVSADAITGSPTATTDVAARVASASGTEDNGATATASYVAGTTLFDETGSSLLVITGSSPIDLFAPREKLRGGGAGGWNGTGGGNGGGNGNGGGGGLVPDGVIAGLGSGVPSSSIGNVSFSSGSSAVGVGTTTTAPVATPEPSSLVLLGSGIALVARRLARARQQRRAV